MAQFPFIGGSYTARKQRNFAAECVTSVSRAWQRHYQRCLLCWWASGKRLWLKRRVATIRGTLSSRASVVAGRMVRSVPGDSGASGYAGRHAYAFPRLSLRRSKRHAGDDVTGSKFGYIHARTFTWYLSWALRSLVQIRCVHRWLLAFKCAHWQFQITMLYGTAH